MNKVVDKIEPSRIVVNKNGQVSAQGHVMEIFEDTIISSCIVDFSCRPLLYGINCGRSLSMVSRERRHENRLPGHQQRVL